MLLIAWTKKNQKNKFTFAMMRKTNKESAWNAWNNVCMWSRPYYLVHFWPAPKRTSQIHLGTPFCLILKSVKSCRDFMLYEYNMKWNICKETKYSNLMSIFYFQTNITNQNEYNIFSIVNTYQYNGIAKEWWTIMIVVLSFWVTSLELLFVAVTKCLM